MLSIESASSGLAGYSPVSAISAVQAGGQSASANAEPGSAMKKASPGLNSLSDQPLSPMVMKELMRLYASMHV